MVKCPVCKVEMSDDGSRVLTLGGEREIPVNKIEYKGQTYYFDCGDCAREFAADLDKYVGK
ncbi:MAG: YHS domain-containing protein [Armatimonadota bacterium]|nr:YHS domain-containing protein [bacterium]